MPSRRRSQRAFPLISLVQNTVLPLLHYGGRPISLPARNFANFTEHARSRRRASQPEDDI